MSGKQKGSSKIMVKMSKIQFPEVCPVCLDEPEDLVFVTVLERYGDDYSASSWTKQQDKTSVALEAAKGAATFAIPTCMLHGSKSVRTVKTKLIAVLGFFVMFYPILFYLLEINLYLVTSRSLDEPLFGLFVTTGVLLVILLYTLYPRALERAVRIHWVSRVKDSVLLSLNNEEYKIRFLNLNEMTAAIMYDDAVEIEE